MIFLKAIRYTYHFVSRKYQKWGEGDIGGVYALCFISFLQLLNAFTLFIIALLFKVVKVDNIKGEHFFILFFILLALNYLVVLPRNVSNLLVDKDKINNSEGRLLSIIYVVLTLILFFSGMLYYIKSPY